MSERQYTLARNPRPCSSPAASTRPPRGLREAARLRSLRRLARPLPCGPGPRPRDRGRGDGAGFPQARGPAPPPAAAGAPRRPARRGLPDAGPGYLDLARAEPLLAMRPSDGSPIPSSSSRTRLRSEPPRSWPSASRCRPTGASEHTKTRRLTSRARPSAPPRRSPGARHCSTCGSSTRSSRPASRFSIHPALHRLGLRVVTVLRFLPPGGGVRAFELVGDPGLVRLDPRWHQAALRFVAAGLPPHPGRDRSPALPALPGDPVPALARARPHRHLVHGRALGHADRLRLRLRSRRAVVPPARRDPDRGLHRLHGTREHRGSAACVGDARSPSPSVSFTGSASRSPSATRCSSRDPTS